MSTVDQVNQQINNIFASNDILPDGPGVEAFWNAVEEVSKVNQVAAQELVQLSKAWETAVRKPVLPHPCSQPQHEKYITDLCWYQVARMDLDNWPQAEQLFAVFKETYMLGWTARETTF